jgi:hypothetical protein
MVCTMCCKWISLIRKSRTNTLVGRYHNLASLVSGMRNRENGCNGCIIYTGRVMRPFVMSGEFQEFKGFKLSSSYHDF